MAKDPDLDWFPFFPVRWLMSDGVDSLSDALQGAYVKCMCVQWVKGSIPGDVATLRKAAKIGSGVTNDELDSLRQTFFKRKIIDGNFERFANEELLQIKKEQTKKHQVAKNNGKKGGLAKVARLKPPSSLATILLEQNSSHPLALDQIRLDQIRSDQIRSDLTQSDSRACVGEIAEGFTAKSFAQVWEELTGQSRMHIPAGDLGAAAQLCATDPAPEPFARRAVTAFMAYCTHSKKHTSPTTPTPAKFVTHFDKVIAGLADPTLFSPKAADPHEERDRRAREFYGITGVVK